MFNNFVAKNPGGKMTKVIFRETLAEVIFRNWFSKADHFCNILTLERIFNLEALNGPISYGLSYVGGCLFHHFVSMTNCEKDSLLEQTVLPPERTQFFSPTIYCIIVQALPKREIPNMEKHLFRVYDTNKDGYIDFVEFMVRLLRPIKGAP